MLDYPIEDLDLGVRAYNFARRNGVHTYADLLTLSIADVNAWTCQSNGTIGVRAFAQLAEAQDYVIAFASEAL